MGRKAVKIQNLEELAKHVGAAHPTSESVAHRLYKDTSCGVCFYVDDKGVTVSGYCEGDVGDCPPYRLVWGFTPKKFDKAVEDSDKDGCDLWDQTHGCDYCATPLVAGLRPINPKCKKCGGDGQII